MSNYVAKVGSLIYDEKAMSNGLALQATTSQMVKNTQTFLPFHWVST